MISYLTIMLKTFWPYLWRLLAVAIMTWYCSCAPKYTADKAITDVNKANNAWPAPVANWLRQRYPCIIKTSDTTTVTKDSLIYIDCPDLPVIVHELGPTDTVIMQHTIKVPYHLPIEIQRITTYIEDSARIKVLTSALNAQVHAYTVLQTKYDDMKGERNWWRKFALILIGLIGVYIALRIFLKLKI